MARPPPRTTGLVALLALSLIATTSAGLGVSPMGAQTEPPLLDLWRIAPKLGDPRDRLAHAYEQVSPGHEGLGGLAPQAWGVQVPSSSSAWAPNGVSWSTELATGANYAEPWAVGWTDGAYHFANCHRPVAEKSTGRIQALAVNTEYQCWASAGTWSYLSGLEAGTYSVEYIWKETHTKVTPGGNAGNGGCSGRTAIGWVVGGVYDWTDHKWVDGTDHQMFWWDTRDNLGTMYERTGGLYFGHGSFTYHPSHKYGVGLFGAAVGGAKCSGSVTPPLAKVEGKGEIILAKV